MTTTFLLRRALLTGALPTLLCAALVFALGTRAGASVSLAPEPALPRCFATLGSTTQYSGFTSAVVQLAIDGAPAGALVKVAGDRVGVQARGGTTQTVLITRPLTLEGGYTTSNWLTSDPAANLTILDAGGLGQVVSATADVSLTNLTVQNGWVTCAARPSCSGNHEFNLGGGIFAGTRLMLS